MPSPAPPPNSLPTPATTRSTEPSPHSASEDVELVPVQNGDAKAPLRLEEDIMQCARLGETGLIKKLFDDGRFDAKYKDDEGITPLHVRCGALIRCPAIQLTFLTVGGNKQSICYLQIPCRRRGRCQCEGWRIQCNACHVGCATMPLLCRQPPPPTWHRPPDLGRCRLQYPTPRNHRRQLLSPGASPSPEYTCGCRRPARAHKSHVGSIQGLSCMC